MLSIFYDTSSCLTCVDFSNICDFCICKNIPIMILSISKMWVLGAMSFEGGSVKKIELFPSVLLEDDCHYRSR